MCERCRYWAQSGWAAAEAAERERRWLPYLKFGTLWMFIIPVLIVGVLVPRVYFTVFNARAVVVGPSGDLTSQPVAGEWATEGRDVRHTRFDPQPLAGLRGAVKWRVELGEPTGSTPTVVDGTVYIGGGDFKAYALDADTGAIRWTAPTTGPVHAQPAVAGDLVYFGLLDGRLLALERATGGVRWSFQTGNPLYRSATVWEGRVFFGSGDSNLYSLDAANGRLLWRFPTGGWVRSTPAISEDLLFFTSDDQSIYFLDARSGRLHLRFRTGRSVK